MRRLVMGVGLNRRGPFSMIQKPTPAMTSTQAQPNHRNFPCGVRMPPLFWSVQTMLSMLISRETVKGQLNVGRSRPHNSPTAVRTARMTRRYASFLTMCVIQI